ncbi:hypothetical protein C8R45DRAFT_252520 [Mycena sanguinolenta]|nr:hypothetical protein C8R45DRAFT_252520 [Mycena sanguinolenta]
MSNPKAPELVFNTLPIALIGGFGGKGGRATGPEGQGGQGGQGEGNTLPAAFVYELGARGFAAAGGVGGEGGEGRTPGAGGVGGGNTVHLDKWSFGDTSAVPIIGIEQFCADYQLPDDVHRHLRDFGISIANALFRLKDEDLLALQQSGLKPGHRASLQAALENLVALQQSGLKRGPLLPGVLTALQLPLVGLGRVVGRILAGLGLFGL